MSDEMAFHTTCETCGSAHSDIIDSRRASFAGSVSVRRRRKCRDCGFKWSTLELEATYVEGLLDGVVDV